MARVDSVAGKSVVITGGANGIGRCLALEFGRRGARVAVLDVSEAALAEASEVLDKAGVEHLSARCDVTDPAECEAAIGATTGAFGGVDVLINNAGITHRSLLADTEAAVLRKVLEVNLFGAINCTQAALPSLKERGGRIVAISSVAGFAPLLGRTGYCASKHAMHGFFDTLRTELQPDGVDVLMVCPSFIATDMDTRALNADGGAKGTRRRAVGKQLRPEDVARAIADATEKRKRMLLLSPVAKASLWLWRVAPRMYERLMLRNQGAEFGR